MGPGGFPSLQNWCDPTKSGRVGSIPTLSRHNDLASDAELASEAEFWVLSKAISDGAKHSR